MIGLPEYDNDKWKWKIRIVCEGYEEKDYIDKLDTKAVFSDVYDILGINTKGIGNVFSRYQELYQSNSYHLVLIFCDTDKVSRSAYLELKEKINKYYGKEVADKIIIFGNPTTMQIILSHFGEVQLKSQSKHTNQQIIKELTEIDNYDATEEQRKELFKKITKKNYQVMKQNLSNISTDDSVKPSTNILPFLEKLEKDDVQWIKDINKELLD